MPEQVYVDCNEAVLRNIPERSTILDVGCGPGFLGELLPTCTVYGIDSSQTAINLAKKHIFRTYHCDITQDLPELPRHFFDVIVFADILEHVAQPDVIIKKFIPYLKKEGVMLVSLPNIANWTIRLKLLFGSFSYTKTGILDNTHLRFFTYKTACEFFHSNNFDILRIDYTPNFVRSLLTLIKLFHRPRYDESHYSYLRRLFASRHYRAYRRLLLPIERFITRLWKSLFAYQFIFVIRPWTKK